jgi:GntR family transcriptional repressor for pyruvate dehydrogenase complex
MEFRTIIEKWAVGRFAERHSPEAFSTLAELVEAMESDHHTPEDWQDLDTAFHSTFVEASGNELAFFVWSACRTSIKGSMLVGLRSVDDWPPLRARLAGEHRDILEAIRAGDTERASVEVERHLVNFYKNLSEPLP